MSKRTNKYQLGYFEQDDLTDPIIESQRWAALDVQLYALFSVIGNGIKYGWDLVVSDGLNITISPGEGHVGFVSLKSLDDQTILNLLPSSTAYIYAELGDESYWTQSVTFSAYYSPQEGVEDILYLGSVTTNEVAVIDTDGDGRSYLGFQNLIDEAVRSHRHIGGENNPDPIDLGSEVQGVLNQRNIPELDASKVITGTIDPDRIPEIDHLEGLENQGTLTHNQLDSFVEVLNLEDNKKMGEVSTVNLLQLVLALKHAYPDIDEYLVNSISYIPGISPDDYVDMVNTTAEVDYRTYAEGGEHTISMSPGLGLNGYTKLWDSSDDFEEADSSNVFVDGNLVCLSTDIFSENLESFNDIDNWEVSTEDLSTTSNANLQIDSTDYVNDSSSAKLTINRNENDIALFLKRVFDPQDWSSFSFLTFYIKTENVNHGDWVFYLKDSVFGVQNSYQKILDRNTPTINVDTLENGWQEVTIDIKEFSRSSVNEITLYTSTQIGWDSSQDFDLNIDNFVLSTGSLYEDDGYLRFIYENGFPVNFWRTRWDAIIPSDENSTGLVFQVRFRRANTLAGLSIAEWSEFLLTSGTNISDGELYKFIEIECFFQSSENNKRSPCLNQFYLDFYANEDDSQFTFSSQDDWESGKLFNIDTTSNPGSIQISGTSGLGTHYFAADGIAGGLDEDLDTEFSFTGSSLPQSTYQKINNLAPSFGYISGVARGNYGDFWLTDLDNDRVVRVDRYGNLNLGFYGSFLSPPKDNYGLEEFGPGSNVEEVVGGDAEQSNQDGEPSEQGGEQGESQSETISVLHSIYNNEEGVLYIVFDDDLDYIYESGSGFNKNGIFLKIGSVRFNLSDSNYELLGVPEDKYQIWGDLSSSENEELKFLNQFNFNSHVLKITVEGSEKTGINQLLSGEFPSISLGFPFQNYRTSSDSVSVNFLIKNLTLGSGVGEYGIKLTIDGSPPFVIYEDNYEITGLLEGDHTVDFVIVNDSNDELTNEEASSSLMFNVSSTYEDPYLSIQYPRPNQVYSSSPISLDFKSENFPIIPTGQHIQYQIDSGSVFDHYSSEPILLNDISPGKHNVRIYTVDEDGSYLSYGHGDINVDFIVGLNNNALMNLYVNKNSIYSKFNKPSVSSVTSVDIANVFFRNIYSPIDIQMIPNDTGGLAGGDFSVLVSKLRSKSWMDGLSGQDEVKEINTRFENIAREGSGEDLLEVNPSFSGIQTRDLIYGDKYLDGHSVTQLDPEGKTFFSNNIAKFANDKAQAREVLGSAEKIGSSELLIADSIRKRAVISYTDLETKGTEIEWQYDSDRFIVDFHIVPQDQISVEIYDGSISEQTVFVRQGTTIVWKNSSSSPISIYSGSTSYDLFQLDPDLSIYGEKFISPVLNPGETWSFEFINDGEFDWFTYPDILTGEVNITKQRISSRDQYYILESDGLESPFTSRLIKVDSWGNVIYSFGESLLVKPRDVRSISNGKILIST